MTDSADASWARIKATVSDAMDVAVELRPAWVERACGGDDTLRAEVEALLRAHDRAGTFLEEPAVASPDAAARVVEAAGPAPGAPALPARFGPYRVLRELGRGGMGVVYLGARDDDRFDKQVAIKVVSGDVVHPAVFRRFEDERRILASLDHPHIARLLDAGTTPGGQPYVVMEYVAGEPIDGYCAARRLAPRERLVLFLRVCGAVEYSHQHLVVHRDIKARNILVTPDGVPQAPRLRDRQAAGAGRPGREPDPHRLPPAHAGEREPGAGAGRPGHRRRRRVFARRAAVPAAHGPQPLSRRA